MLKIKNTIKEEIYWHHTSLLLFYFFIFKSKGLLIHINLHTVAFVISTTNNQWHMEWALSITWSD